MVEKVVVVTGVSRGIGKAIVEDILDRDCETVVVGIARTASPLQQLQEKYGKDKFQFVVGDVCDSQTQENLKKCALMCNGNIDAFIANAGVLKPVTSVLNYHAEDWKTHFDVNFFSVVSLTSLLLPHLIKSQGNIIYVSSGASVKPYYGWSSYCASKAALNNYARSVASEIPEVRTISVAPGVVNTQMQNDIRDTFGPQGMTPEALKRFTDLARDNQLLQPSVPAKVYATLALEGIPPQLDGQYVRYSDEGLVEALGLEIH